MFSRLSGLLALSAIAGASAAPLRPVPGAASPAALTANVAYTRAHRAVSTGSPGARTAFDDGLTLLYAFNPEQARRSFQAAANADPKLAIAWWGVAMSYGPNINTSFDAAQGKLGNAAIAKARALEATASPAERALIAAATQRFADDGPRDADRSARAYRDAMDAAANAFPNDDDVQTLAAEAALDAENGAYDEPDGRLAPATAALVARLERVLERDPTHIGANHFVIHALERSNPKGALASANRLAADTFEPAAEHLAHMPAHVYMQVGRYHAAGAANARALALYDVYLGADPAGHADYYQHDCVFGVDAFMMSGEYERARTMASACARGGAGMVPIVDLRFRRWNALDADGETTDLGAGVLAAHRGRLADARKHLATLEKSSDDVGKIQAVLVAAAIAGASADNGSRIASLMRAVALEDGLGYSEPPPFFYPVRETLGAAYLSAKRYADAERTFRADLTRNPDNPRSLFGLAQTLAFEGRSAEAKQVRQRFGAVWKGAAPTDLATL